MGLDVVAVGLSRSSLIDFHESVVGFAVAAAAGSAGDLIFVGSDDDSF